MKKRTISLGGGGINELNPSKKAFTLAEVLITLAIIGIVAALTIPTLVSKNEKKQLYTSFMKTYNTLSNALNLSISENGNPSTWVYDDDDTDSVMEKYLAPYLKVAKTCTGANLTDCYPKPYKSLNSVTVTDDVAMFTQNANTAVVLSDGTIVAVNQAVFYSGDNNFQLVIDTNGQKGPNTLGRDLFLLDYETRYIDGRPSKNYTLGAVVKYQVSGYDSYGYERLSNCDPNEKTDMSQGIGCAARLLSEGAMNY